MSKIFKLILLILLHGYVFTLCTGALLCVIITAYIFLFWSKLSALLFGKNPYHAVFFVFPFQSYKDWKNYIGLIRKFIFTTSFSKTYWLLYYKFRTNSEIISKPLPYFKFPIEVENKEFYTIDEFPGLMILLQNQQLILNEYQNASKHLKPYINETGSAHNDWHTIFLYGSGQLNTNVADKFTETLKLITHLPEVDFSMIMFSVLEPGAHIPLHTGPFNCFVKVHLPLIIPAQTTECTIRVGEKITHWKNNELVLFDDSYAHTVTNNTNETRVILMLAVWKPGINNKIKPIIKRFITLLNSSPPFKRWTIDNM